MPAVLWGQTSGCKHPPARAGIGIELTAHDVAEREDGLICKRVVREQSILPPGNEALRVQQLKVLRDIGLAKPRLTNQVGDRHFMPSHALQNLQACRLGECSKALRHECKNIGCQFRFCHVYFSCGTREHYRNVVIEWVLNKRAWSGRRLTKE